jgi:hypothetical protein
MNRCHHQSDPATCPTCLHRAKKAGKPLLIAIHDAADQFSENHQALSGLMFNTLCAIVEDLVGPVVKAANDERDGYRDQTASACKGLERMNVKQSIMQATLDGVTLERDHAVATVAEYQAHLEKREKFKAYVHKRLDDAGVPKFDDGRECRIGARLDWMLSNERNTAAAVDVLSERMRQVSKEGWTAAHDDEHDDGSLAHAAATYALQGGGTTTGRFWPDSWAPDWFKPHDRRRSLVIAGALILAEIERIDRVPVNPEGNGPHDTGAAIHGQGGY